MSNTFSENSLLKKIFPLLSTNEDLLVPPGDDCAVLKSGGKNLSITVDQLIENRHYLSTTSAYDAGRKLMARNLSDIAAMGGNPKFAVMTSATSFKGEDWLLEFHRGVIEEGKKHQVVLIGGDLAGTDNDNVSSLTLIGEVNGTGILRSGAKPGNFLYVTGTLGASFESEHHLKFQPRIEEGSWLNKYAEAMIDITDGLLTDLSRMCSSSKCGAELNLEKIPLRNYQGNTLSKALCDGEDYELLFAVPADKAEFLEKDWPFTTKLTMIGRFIENSDCRVISNKNEDLLEKFGEGYDHFR
ncbi:MAG: thiamine-phosphate kinase [Lentisphaeraceae bacterium]|nr:thiamine-phosphate kinase [Lentisphaeraceae bacterium]